MSARDCYEGEVHDDDDGITTCTLRRTDLQHDDDDGDDITLLTCVMIYTTCLDTMFTYSHIWQVSAPRQ